MTVTGNGFDPISTVAITFGGSSVTTVTPTSNGEFTATFNVPPSSNGNHSVIATQGSKSASKTFTVTLGSINSTATTASSPDLSEKMILPDIFA